MGNETEPTSAGTPETGLLRTADPRHLHIRREVPEEMDGWLREKDELLQKKFESGLSAPESRRLDYLVWLIDQIEDPVLAASLDRLERLAAEYASLARTVNDVAAEVTAAIGSEPRARRRR